MRTLLSLSLVLAAAACRGASSVPAAPPGPAPIATAMDIVMRVVGAHASTAPRTVAFTQVNIVTLASGNLTQRQRAVIEAPGLMRVEYLPESAQSGAVYLRGRAITFAGGRRVAGADERNPLLLLGFSIFRAPATDTHVALASLGVRTSVIRQASYDGTPVWVIGAAAGDSTSNQVWIDSERWLPVRLIQSQRVGTRTLVSDTRYSGHASPTPTIPRVIEVYRDGRRALRGTIEAVRTGMNVPASAFDTTALRAVSY